MASVNKVILVGHLGRDPEVRYSSDGAAITTLSIATSSKSKDKATGETREETEWHKIVLFSRVAEVAAEFLKKGSQAYIEGRLRTRKWTDSSGADRYSTEIIGDQLQLLGDGGRDKAQSTSPAKAAPAKPVYPENGYHPANSKPSYKTRPAPKAFEDMDDDIPF